MFVIVKYIIAVIIVTVGLLAASVAIYFAVQEAKKFRRAMNRIRGRDKSKTTVDELGFLSSNKKTYTE